MADKKITVRDKTRLWTLATGQRHVFRIHRFKTDLVEVEDLHFHLDSAVMLPDRDPADVIDDKSGSDLDGLSVIRASYQHVAANPTKKILCLGHTDRSGSNDYNRKLSELRARNVRAVLVGDGDEWATTATEKHVVRDHQLILKWLANVRYWPDCDPGKVDGDAGGKTSRAIKAFKKRFNDDYGGSLSSTESIDKATWMAFFKLYMVALAGLMQTDEAGLSKHRGALKWLSPAWVGCGEGHPMTPELAINYRSPTDRRVELLFFDPGEEPELAPCHPSSGACVPDECELYRKRFFGWPVYRRTPIVINPNAKVALRLTEVRGLYKPGHIEPADVAAGAGKLSGYLKGYKADDDLGRIFVNQVPRVDTSVSWEDVKKKNQQFVELAAVIDVAEGTLPPDAQVVWEWSDPDDPSDADMRDDAAAIIDANDFDKRGRVGAMGDDNQGHCDFPKPGASREPIFEQLGPYKLTPDAAGSKRCFTLISGRKSEVRFHCTDAGGDNFRLQATVRPAPGLVVTTGDHTGSMTMWKRIDVEHRRMKDAESIPAKDMVPFFEKQFVQMDVAPEELTSSNDQYIDKSPDDDLVAEFVDNEFKNKKKPGWFFICVAREAAAPAGKVRRTLYEGPGTLVIGGPIPLIPLRPGGYFDNRGLPQWESVVINAVLKETPLAVTFVDDGKDLMFFVDEVLTDVPKGKSTIRLSPIDFQSDFDHNDGSWKQSYAKRAFYFPRYRYRWPERVWEKKGYGFADDVMVNVVSKGSAITAGTSPEVRDAAGRPHFAGRTVVFARNPAYTKLAEAKVQVQGTWSVGDRAEVTVDGITGTYVVKAEDVAVPSDATDAVSYIHGQVARGIESAINAHGTLSKEVTALASFGRVRVRAVAPGVGANGRKISVSPDAGAGRPAVLSVSDTELKGGGFTDESRKEIVHVFTHELGHAFGFPHKCGYHTFENPAGMSCTMNYFHTWLYKLGTHLDPAAREVERFGPGAKGNHFCALHTRGIRLVKLEDNPVIWNW